MRWINDGVKDISSTTLESAVIWWWRQKRSGVDLVVQPVHTWPSNAIGPGTYGHPCWVASWVMNINLFESLSLRLHEVSCHHVPKIREQWCSIFISKIITVSTTVIRKGYHKLISPHHLKIPRSHMLTCTVHTYIKLTSNSIQYDNRKTAKKKRKRHIHLVGCQYNELTMRR